MAHSTAYVVGFAGAVCLVCSLGVAGAAMGLRDLQDANKLIAFQEKVLEAVGLPEEVDGKRTRLTKDLVSSTFEERIRLILVDESGEEVLADATDEEKVERVKKARSDARSAGGDAEVHPVYLRVAGDEIEAHAIELRGKGLWGPISGFIALKPDGETVMNVAFDPQKETPGLGAEIAQPPFMRQWRGKSIRSDGDLVPIEVVKGSAELACSGRVEHCVDGVSGATITSRGVDAMVEEAVKENYSSYLNKIQAGS